MPLYNFECIKCKAITEKYFPRPGEYEAPPCEHCSAKTEWIWSAPAMHPDDSWHRPGMKALKDSDKAKGITRYNASEIDSVNRDYKRIRKEIEDKKSEARREAIWETMKKA